MPELLFVPSKLTLIVPGHNSDFPLLRTELRRWSLCNSSFLQNFGLSISQIFHSQFAQRGHLVQIMSSCRMGYVQTGHCFLQPRARICTGNDRTALQVFLQMTWNFPTGLSTTGSTTCVRLRTERFHHRLFRESSSNAQHPTMLCFLFRALTVLSVFYTTFLRFAWFAAFLISSVTSSFLYSMRRSICLNDLICKDHNRRFFRLLRMSGS